MSSTDSTRSRRIVFSLTDHCDGEFLYPPCRFESWAMLQHCGGSFAEILGGKRCQKASHCGEMIGELNAIRSTITDRIPGAQCVMLTLCLKSGDNVCVSMFDSIWLLRFIANLRATGKNPKLCLLQA
ncbi:uncharacterized protein LOC106388780 [Brassica napus]|uniref:uncharacterized protein LOC106388780 n=1 Tax=Brassica napus TaxID=3708 RepID=UPI00207AA0A4|nr:uncharacterized protein LOC106388780 [Brassica napus]XP_048605943.1 uncharacterized protein LOC106388780 [Brassica napus]